MKPERNVKLGQSKKNAPSKQKKVDIGAMSVDDFMQNGFDISDESGDESNVGENRTGSMVSSGKDHNGVASDSDSGGVGKDDEELENDMNDEANSEDEGEENESDINELVGDDSDEDEDDGDEDEDVDGDKEDEGCDNSKKDKKKLMKNEDDEGDWTSDKFSHKKAVAKLKKSDPEFYKFLKENDKDLLNFDESDSDTEGKGDEEAGGIIHKPPESLEVASDESDYEDGVKKDFRAITLKMVKLWETKLQKTTPKSCETIEEVIHAFHAVLVRVSTEDDEETKYVVTGSAVFNAVIQLCVLELQPALKKFLRIPSGKHVDPSKSKSQWTKVSKSISGYIFDLVKQNSKLVAAMAKAKAEHQKNPVHVLKPTVKAGKALDATFTKTFDSTFTVQSSTSRNSSNLDNAYNLEDIESGDSDEEDNLPKQTARWAKKSVLMPSSKNELRVSRKACGAFCAPEINISAIFPKKSFKRTSSAIWTTPPRYSVLPKY